jgi:hypothetical protein
MKKLILVIAIILLPVLSKSQVFPDSLYLHLYNFLILKGELDANRDISKLKELFFIKELVNYSNIENFKIYTFNQQAYEDGLPSIFTLEKDTFEIYDRLSFYILIEKILDLKNVNEQSKNIWIKGILNVLYMYNGDIGDLGLMYSYGKYIYYIKERNNKNSDGIIKIPKNKL